MKQKNIIELMYSIEKKIQEINGKLKENEDIQSLIITINKKNAKVKEIKNNEN